MNAVLHKRAPDKRAPKQMGLERIFSRPVGFGKKMVRTQSHFVLEVITIKHESLEFCLKNLVCLLSVL